MIKRYRALLALALLPVTIAGCEDYEFTAPISSFAVSPVFTSIDEGTSVQLEATDSNGNPVNVTWKSDNTNVITVNGSGLAFGAGPGVTAVIASNGSESQSASITVNQLQGTSIQKGVPLAGIGGPTGSSQLYRIFVPAGTTELVFTMSGGSGDADLYVRRGVPPTNASADYWSFNAGNGELITVNNPQQGTWYVLVDVWETFAGATLTATYTP